MIICLEPDADLHMAQLMPLPLSLSSISKIQIGFTFLVLAHPVVPEKGLLNMCVIALTMVKGRQTGGLLLEPLLSLHIQFL